MRKALAFHGYKSSPANIQWLVDILKEVGLDVIAPSYRDVEEGYEAGLKELPVAIAAGHSLGGTVAMLIAARNPGAVGCVIAVGSPVDRRLQLQYLLQSENPYLRRIANELAALGSRLEQTSPSRYINSKMPPVLYIRGSSDWVVPRVHVDILVGLSDRFNFPLEVTEVDGMEHTPQSVEHLEKIREVVAKFVSRC
ncbi:MAG: alpha/beta hydrolase family protein [Pyrobaculum sp.]